MYSPLFPHLMILCLNSQIALCSMFLFRLHLAAKQKGLPEGKQIF